MGGRKSRWRAVGLWDSRGLGLAGSLRDSPWDSRRSSGFSGGRARSSDSRNSPGIGQRSLGSPRVEQRSSRAARYTSLAS